MAEHYNGRMVPSDVLLALRGNRIIDAIRQWRDFTGDSLLDAKNFIEAIRAQVLASATTPTPSAPMSNELPREELLRKMLNMTTSDNDGQALVAIRKANALLASEGWNWDKLLAGKIKIVENPFKNMPNPAQPAKVAPTRSPPPPPQAWQGPPRDSKGRLPLPPYIPPSGHTWTWDKYADAWVATAIAPRQSPVSPGLGLTRKNIYASHCYCCGDYVANDAGFIMKPRDYNSQAVANKWFVVCAPCNKTLRQSHVLSRPAPKNTGQTTSPAPAPTLGDL